MSDIEIARKAKMKPISEILKGLDVPDTPKPSVLWVVI